MNRLNLIIIILVLLMALLIWLDFAKSGELMSESMMALGFLLMVSYLVGKIISQFKLPKITGYIIAGIITGPYLLNLLSKPVVQDLQLIDNLDPVAEKMNMAPIASEITSNRKFLILLPPLAYIFFDDDSYYGVYHKPRITEFF